MVHFIKRKGCKEGKICASEYASAKVPPKGAFLRKSSTAYDVTYTCYISQAAAGFRVLQPTLTGVRGAYRSCLRHCSVDNPR
jgi:hypothetical protein